MIVIGVKNLKRTMESKRKFWKSLGSIKKCLGALSSILWAENLRPQCLGTNKQRLGALNITLLAKFQREGRLGTH